MNTFDWDDLRVFLAMARSGSLSGAARNLEVEHSTVARRLTRLEKSLDCKLFNRMARGWSLTPEGEALLERAALLEDDIHSIKRAPLANGPLAGPVRISAPPALLSAIIVPFLEEFVVQYPEIRLQSVGEFREADLSRGEADIALRMVEPTAAELVTRVVGHVAYGLYGVAEWASVSEAERNFIGFLPSAKFWLALKLDSYVNERRYALRSNDIHIILSAAREGLGIALLPRFIADKEPDLLPLRGVDKPIVCPLSLVMQRDVRQAPRIRLVADYLARNLATSQFQADKMSTTALLGACR